jgi:heterogeneous nuclear rnp K-like protein 2
MSQTSTANKVDQIDDRTAEQATTTTTQQDGSLNNNNTTATTATATSTTSNNNEEEGEEEDDGLLTLRALVSTKEAGVIIGKAGKNVAELREETGVKAGVSKVVQGIHDRVLTINGTLEGVAKAYSSMAQTLLDNPISPTTPPISPTAATRGNNNEGVVTIRLLISHNLMGTVIGRQGAKIKHIQDTSGVRMTASKTLLPQSTERVVEVRGSVEGIRLAMFEIGRCLIEDKDRAYGTILYNPSKAGVLTNTANVGSSLGVHDHHNNNNNNHHHSHHHHQQQHHSHHHNNNNNHSHNNNHHQNNRRSSYPRTGNGSADFGGHNNYSSNNNNNNNNASNGNNNNNNNRRRSTQSYPDNVEVKTQHISIPSDMVGCIIGKGGSKISEIRRLSGSRISIAKVPHDETGERMFTIQGTSEANERALYLLYGQLESEKERRLQGVIHEDILEEEEDDAQQQQKE